MKQVIVFPRGQLTKEDRATIATAGAVAVEADDPSKVVCAIPAINGIVNADDFTRSALEAIANHNCAAVGSDFVARLAARTKKREGAA